MNTTLKGRKFFDVRVYYSKSFCHPVCQTVHCWFSYLKAKRGYIYEKHLVKRLGIAGDDTENLTNRDVSTRLIVFQQPTRSTTFVRHGHEGTPANVGPIWYGANYGIIGKKSVVAAWYTAYRQIIEIVCWVVRNLGFLKRRRLRPCRFQENAEKHKDAEHNLRRLGFCFVLGGFFKES